MRNNSNINGALAREQATARFIEKRVCGLIAGPGGTGKSLLATVLDHSAVRAGYDVVFTTQSQLLGSLNSAPATATYERRFLILVRAPLLIIDDFGLKPLRPSQAPGRGSARPHRRALLARLYLVTSNLDFCEWGEAFPNRLLSAVTLNRLRHAAHRVIIHVYSYRFPRHLSQH